MGKFEEMCHAYAEARDEFSKFKQDSHDFASELWKKMLTYLEVPAQQANLYKIGPKGSFDVANPPVTEFLTLRADGFWEFGLGIIVFDSPTTFPRDTILLYLMVRRGLKGDYQIKVNGMNGVFQVEKDDDTTYYPFFDQVFNTIIESYKSGLERLVKEQTTNRIGFDLNDITTAPIKKEG